MLRGLHFQTRPGQTKLMRCGRGRIWDVAVDVRLDSPTYGEWFGIELDDVEHAQLYVPIGFAHGFCVLSDDADVCTRCRTRTTGRPKRGSRGTTRTWPSTGRSTTPIVSARDTGATRLADFDWSTTVWQTSRSS